MTEALSSLAIPAVLFGVCLCFLGNGERYASFVKGAKEGLTATAEVLPAMTLLLVALTLFRESGAADGIASLLTPACEAVGLPPGIVPLAITRPFSGSAGIAAYKSVLERFGPDSFESYAASILLGTGDTLFYVIPVYYSATRVRRTGWVLPAAIFTAVFGLFLSCLLARIFYR